MSERQPYSRVYWSIQHDTKFDGIREDMRLIGSWLTLLVVADQAWPAPAYLPPVVPKACIRALTGAGLVDVLTGGRYRIRGLDAERTKRARIASASANARWSQSERNANGLLDETRLDEARRDGTPVENGRRLNGGVQP